MNGSGRPTDRGDFDERRLRRLIAARCDDTLSPTEQVELEGMLRTSKAARAVFLQDASIHAWLEVEVPAQEGVAALIESGQVENPQRDTGAATPPAPQATSAPSLRRLVTAAATASLTLAASGLLVIGLFGPAQEKAAKQAAARVNGTPQADVPAIADIGSISDATEGCQWMFERQSATRQSTGKDRHTIHDGDTLRVVEGKVRLEFDHGTIVNLEGPALIEVVSSMRARLFRGRATVKVAPGAEGFTIDTPRTSVIDLGTEFGVEVDDLGCTDVVVFTGMVDVAFSRDIEESDAMALRTRRLHMGTAMRINQRGAARRITSLNSRRFTRDGDRAESRVARKPIISAVRDNIRSGDAWRFYEIVTGGMCEDAIAFVDREQHEWNGVDAQGMPDYLIGGDYVKTFNDDKKKEHYALTVTVDEPANLYLLWCDRVEPPAWLVEEFENTGDFIGVDEGKHTFRSGEELLRDAAEVGPGLSIESRHSIWRLAIDSPGDVELGPAKTNTGKSNMYGIVATPLGAETN